MECSDKCPISSYGTGNPNDDYCPFMKCDETGVIKVYCLYPEVHAFQMERTKEDEG
jgi:hypothetical protein